MCGRFTTEISSELLADLFGLAGMTGLSSRYNVAPTQLVPVIRRLADGRNRLDQLFWGLIPSWAKDRSLGSKMINARSETVTEKPAFRQAVRFRRCLVLASGFYEWKQQGKEKSPLYIRLKDNGTMVFAGLWEIWKSAEGEVVESCCILTTASNRLIEPLHQRMPVILPRDQFGVWLDRALSDPACLTHLFQPYPSELMEMWPVSRMVNSSRGESPDFIIPVEDAPVLELFNCP
jgi:putative SOS response-associated peptidase YedK